MNTQRRPIARLDRNRGADGAIEVADGLFDTVLGGFGCRELGDGLLRRRCGADFLQCGGQRSGRPHPADRPWALWVGRIDIGIGRGRNMRQGSKRQPVADRTVARHQENMAAARPPLFRPPAMGGGFRLPALDRQNETGRPGQAARKHGGDPMPFFGIFELGVFRRHIVGKIAFLDDPFRRVLIGRGDMVIGDARDCRQWWRAIPWPSRRWPGRCPCPRRR